MAAWGTIVILTFYTNFHILNYSNEWCRLSTRVMRLCAHIVHAGRRETEKGVINNSSFNLNEMASCPRHHNSLRSVIVLDFSISSIPCKVEERVKKSKADEVGTIWKKMGKAQKKMYYKRRKDR